MGIANVDAAAQHWSSEGSDAVSVVKTPPPRRVRGHIPYLRRKEVSTRNVFSAVGLVDQDPLLTDVGPLTDIDDWHSFLASDPKDIEMLRQHTGRGGLVAMRRSSRPPKESSRIR